MRAHKSDIKKHSTTGKHLKNIKALDKQPNIRTAVTTKSNKVSYLEITLAMHVACHSSIRSVDHLSDNVKQSMALNSGADSIRLHRKKCTALRKK